MSAPLLLFVEGEHDIVFFRKWIEFDDCFSVKTVKPLGAGHQIQAKFAGVLIVDCEGIPKIYRIICRLMRQIIVNLPLPFPRLVAIGDSDRFSSQALSDNIRSYLVTPCKAHNLQFAVTQTNGWVSLTESTRDRLLKIDCQTIPESLEIQIYDSIPKEIKQRTSSEGTIDSKLSAAAGHMGFEDLKSLIEASVEWLAPTHWLKNVRRSVFGDGQTQVAVCPRNHSKELA